MKRAMGKVMKALLPTMAAVNTVCLGIEAVVALTAGSA
jgi:hypothetical protein